MSRSERLGLSQKWERNLLILILAAYTLYAAVFIVKTIFWVDGVPYSALFDDMMISMTYARNLAQGYGPVWNAGGERVEGFSNPLWVAFMAFIHLLPIAENWTSLAVQISGGIFFFASLLTLRRVAVQVSAGQRRDLFLRQPADAAAGGCAGLRRSGAGCAAGGAVDGVLLSAE